MASVRPPLAERYDLRPHPEGGWYRETFRSATKINPMGTGESGTRRRRSISC